MMTMRSESELHLRHPAVTLPHLRDLDEEFPNWWCMTQTPIDTLRTVLVSDIVGSATGSGWQFLSDWTPREPDSRFNECCNRLRSKGLTRNSSGHL
jgi:hypothetical protein